MSVCLVCRLLTKKLLELLKFYVQYVSYFRLEEQPVNTLVNQLIIYQLIN